MALAIICPGVGQIEALRDGSGKIESLAGPTRKVAGNMVTEHKPITQRGLSPGIALAPANPPLPVVK
jgi:hypothetical protein